MDNIQQHIQKDQEILENPMISSQSRRHTQAELESLERWAKDHPEDSHDPSPLELFCNDNPMAPECILYDV